MLTPEEKKERKKAYDAANYAANREQILVRSAAYREANREQILVRSAAYYAANKTQIREWQKAHYEANREQRSEYFRRQYQHSGKGVHMARIEDWRSFFDSFADDTERCIAAHVLMFFADCDRTAKADRDGQFVRLQLHRPSLRHRGGSMSSEYGMQPAEPMAEERAAAKKLRDAKEERLTYPDLAEVQQAELFPDAPINYATDPNYIEVRTPGVVDYVESNGPDAPPLVRQVLSGYVVITWRKRNLPAEAGLEYVAGKPALRPLPPPITMVSPAWFSPEARAVRPRIPTDPTRSRSDDGNPRFYGPASGGFGIYRRNAHVPGHEQD